MTALSAVMSSANAQLKDIAPVRLVAGTVVTVFVTQWLARNYQCCWPSAVKASLVGFVKRQINEVPVVKYETMKKLSAQAAEMQAEVFPDGSQPVGKIPAEGGSEEELVDGLRREYEQFCERARAGELSGAVYTDPSGEHARRQAELAKFTAFVNTLHRADFPTARKCEAELVSWIGELYGAGGTRSCGVCTSGGTESNIAAMRAYFNRAREAGIANPVILAPLSAHDSILTKAADLGEVVTVPIDPLARKVDLEELGKLMGQYGSRLAAIVGSYPTYCHGVEDPLQAMSDLIKMKFGYKKFVPGFHVDACLGSLLAPFGVARLPFHSTYVTSVSADPHKYGYSAKGISVCLFRNENYMKAQFYQNASWTGGIYATSGVRGSYPAFPAAAANFSMRALGRSGLQEIAKRIISMREDLQDRVSKIDGIHIVGDPLFGSLALESSQFNVYVLADKLAKLKIPFEKMQGPPAPAILIRLTDNHDASFVDRAVVAIDQCVEQCKREKDSPLTGQAALYGQVQSLGKLNPDATAWIVNEYVAMGTRAAPKSYTVEEKTFTDWRSRLFMKIYNWNKPKTAE